jgi:hypothetical protein
MWFVGCVVVAAAVGLLLLLLRGAGAKWQPRLEIEVEVKGGKAVLASLCDEELGQAAECMAAAFEDSPWWRFIGKDREGAARRRLLAFVFERNMRAMLGRDPHTVLGLRDAEGFACVFMLCSPPTSGRLC